MNDAVLMEKYGLSEKEKGTMKRTCCIGLLISALLACSSLLWAETAKELHVKGEEAHKAKNYEKAVEYYTEALKIEPKRYETLYSRGVNHYKLAEYEKALLDFSQLKDIKGIDHHAWHYIGLIYTKDEKYPEALVAFKKAANLQPKNVLYCLNSARTAAKMKDWKAAEFLYDRALKLDPKNDEAYEGVRYARWASYEEGKKKAKQPPQDRRKR